MKDLQVILDTNFLMIPGLYGVDIFSELDRILDRKYELILPEVVIGELEHLEEEGDSSERRAASVALDLASRTAEIPSQGPADEEIIRLAREEDEMVVGTNDSDLKKRVRNEGIPVIFLRQKSHLDISGTV